MDLLGVTIPAPQTPPVPATGVDILHDNENTVVADKPVRTAAHTSPGWGGPTVLGDLEAAGYQITGYGPPECQRIVHWFGAGASDAMMVVKSELACPVMKHAFKKRTVTRIYHAVATGHMGPPSGTIETSIGRHPLREW